MIDKQRSPQNRTLVLTDSERDAFTKQLLVPMAPLTVTEVTNRTIRGDLLHVLDYLPEAFADLLIIDPPYNLDRSFDGRKFRSRSEADYLAYLESWFPRVLRLLKPNGSVYLCGDWKCTAALATVMHRHLTVRNRITWQREKGRGSKDNWKNSMEDIWYGVKDANDYYFDLDAVKLRRRVIAPYRQDGKPKDWEETVEGNFRMTHPSNFWDDVTVPYWSMPENTDHPTQKPEKLIAKLILAGCPPDGMVFDPFLGSGTTSVTAKKLGRRYCGVEISNEYACLAEKRLQRVETDQSIQGYADGVFWERNSAPSKNKKSR